MSSVAQSIKRKLIIITASELIEEHFVIISCILWPVNEADAAELVAIVIEKHTDWNESERE